MIRRKLRKLPNWRIQFRDNVPLIQNCVEKYGEHSCRLNQRQSLFLSFSFTEQMVINRNVPRTVGKITLIKNLVIILVHVKYTLYWVGPRKAWFLFKSNYMQQKFFPTVRWNPGIWVFLANLIFTRPYRIKKDLEKRFTEQVTYLVYN